MKKALFLSFILCMVILSCQEKNGPEPIVPAAENFMNMNPGSSRTYDAINNTPPASTNTFILTSTSRDSIVDGKTYHVFTNSGTGASEYYRVSGSDYYTYQSLPAALGGTKVENLYLKTGAAIGETWSQTYNITYSGVPLAVTITHKTEEKAISRTVNAVPYANSIHISTTISVAGIPPANLITDIDYYYAPGYGLIENTSKIDLNYFGIVSNTDAATKLKTAVLL
jgi:hypothetical protein